MIEKVMTEDQVQMYFIQWFRRTYSDVRIFAIPNGGARAKTTAMQLKLTGVVAGVPDLYVPAWRLWIELKREKTGRLSEVQKDWLNYLRSIGDSTIVAYGLEDAKQQILFFLQKM
jgi:hypothetical protein